MMEEIDFSWGFVHKLRSVFFQAGIFGYSNANFKPTSSIELYLDALIVTCQFQSEVELRIFFRACVN